MLKARIFDFLTDKNIPFVVFEHQPVFTVDDEPIVTNVSGDAKLLASMPQPYDIPRPHLKTLFLKNEKNTQFFLISVSEEKRVDLKALSVSLNHGRLTFGSAQELLSMLSLTPGSVTPYGLLFATAKNILFILDADMLQFEYISFHPAENNLTLLTSTQDFLTCMEKLNFSTRMVAIPTKN